VLFFFFNTEMHERYSHPAMVFLTAYMVYLRRYYLFTLFLLTYALNLEGAIHYFQLPDYNIFVFNPRFIGTLYVLFIASILYFYFRSFFNKEPVYAT
jgi:hypothetical protein